MFPIPKISVYFCLNPFTDGREVYDSNGGEYGTIYIKLLYILLFTEIVPQTIQYSSTRLTLKLKPNTTYLVFYSTRIYFLFL